MELVKFELDGTHLLVCDLLPDWVVSLVQSSPDLKAGAGARVRDQVHNDFAADEWLPTPVLGDRREHPVLDLVPFAGPRGEVADRERQPGLVGHGLER